ncbi:hypothetical protein [Mesorhizobium sp. M0578]|uniref:hypothetical protein n=1 Tax=unclassified Mesorhizobium TaxID=325217 RepID=UPI00333A9C06
MKLTDIRRRVLADIDADVRKPVRLRLSRAPGAPCHADVLIKLANDPARLR